MGLPWQETACLYVNDSLVFVYDLEDGSSRTATRRQLLCHPRYTQHLGGEIRHPMLWRDADAAPGTPWDCPQPDPALFADMVSSIRPDLTPGEWQCEAWLITMVGGYEVHSRTRVLPIVTIDPSAPRPPTMRII